VAGRHDRLQADLTGGKASSFSESNFLHQLGSALRHARTNCRMSRRVLADRSGVSERYIALIEAGKGNVSIVLLLRILMVFRGDVTDVAGQHQEVVRNG